MRLMEFKNLLKGLFFIVLFLGLFFSVKVFAINESETSGTNLFIQNPIPAPVVAPTKTTTPQNTNTPTPSTSTQQESTSILMHQNPESPTPGQSVTIDITSYAENLDTSKIDWFVNGKVITSGIGVKSITIQAPASGGASIIMAQITVAGGTKSVISTTIRPTEMDLLFEAIDSYVPPFYKGKALPTSGTFIKVVAVPQILINNVLVKPGNLNYSWQQDLTNVQSSSGFGKNFLLYKNDVLDNSNNIAVAASSSDQKYVSQANITIVPGSPSLSFYREDPALGIMWEKTLQSPHKIKNDETIVAIPYYISPGDIRMPDLTFNWSLNNVPISVFNNYKNKLPLKVEEGTSGASDLKLSIDNQFKFFQTTSGSLHLEF